MHDNNAMDEVGKRGKSATASYSETTRKDVLRFGLPARRSVSVHLAMQPESMRGLA